MTSFAGFWLGLGLFFIGLGLSDIANGLSRFGRVNPYHRKTSYGGKEDAV